MKIRVIIRRIPDSSKICVPPNEFVRQGRIPLEELCNVLVLLQGRDVVEGVPILVDQ